MPRTPGAPLPRSSKTLVAEASARVTALSPERVAEELMRLLAGRQGRRFIGWPEKLFVWLNRLVPTLVGRAIGAQRAQIQRFAKGASNHPVAPSLPLSSTKEH